MRSIEVNGDLMIFVTLQPLLNSGVPRKVSDLRWGSNPRPPDNRSGALPTELLREVGVWLLTCTIYADPHPPGPITLTSEAPVTLQGEGCWRLRLILPLETVRLTLDNRTTGSGLGFCIVMLVSPWFPRGLCNRETQFRCANLVCSTLGSQ